MSEIKYDILKTVSGNYRTTFNKVYQKRKKWESVNPGHVLSFMPGTVEQINVKTGDKVNKGDTIMVFRAMKMNNNILSPVSGCVKSINVAQGDNLPKNTVMIEIK